MLSCPHHSCRKPRAGFEELLHLLILEPNSDHWWLVQATKDAKKERFCHSPEIPISYFARRGRKENRPLEAKLDTGET